MEVYHTLFSAWGDQGWWPASTPLEMMVGAVLTQHTAWGNVEKALDRLRSEGALKLDVLHRVHLNRLAAWIRPAGYYRLKARRLRAFTHMVYLRYGGRLDRMLAEDPGVLRQQLLGVWGIGPETADSILLYAAGQPLFVIDAYTRRILTRHGWLVTSASYDEAAALFTGSLPCDATLYGQYHALLVALAKKHCRARPECASCPLKPWLPSGGPWSNA